MRVASFGGFRGYVRAKDCAYPPKPDAQLADGKRGCREYNSVKSQIEATLGPYKAKLDKLLAAFGCTSVADLDRLVLQTATGDALAHWQQVRNGYDQASV